MKKLFISLAIITAVSSVAFAQKQGKVKETKESQEKGEEETIEDEEEESKLEFGKSLFVPKENGNVDCKLNMAPLDKNVDLGGNDPDYFFKPIPQSGPNDNRDDVSVILDGGNYIMNMKTGKLDRIPGPYDGVPTSDGEFIVSPAMGGHITFYDRNGLAGKDAESFVYDDQSSGAETLNGVYHSLGVLDQKNGVDGSKTVTYRAITDTITTSGDQQKMNTLQFKEYTFEISASGQKKLVGTNGAPQLICSNYPYHMMKTPILSKDGKMLSVYNAETGTSVIYDVQKDKDGKSVCNTKKDLGFAASKMEFSPDGKRVVFAMNSLGTTPSKVDWYEVPDTKTHNMNVYTYDFNTDDLNKITSQPNGNAYYPSFSNNGEDVVWMSQEVGASGQKKYAVKRMALKDSPSMKYVNFTDMRSCQLTDNAALSMMAIGKLWEDVCSELNTGMNISSLATLPLSLSKESCSTLVKKYWITNYGGLKEMRDKNTPNTSKSNIALIIDVGSKLDNQTLSLADLEFYTDKLLSFKEEDLLKTCEGLKGVDGPQAAVVTASMNGPVQKKANPTQSCTQCHSSGDRYIPFDKPEQLGPWKKKMLLHVFTGNMPKNMNLSVKERSELIDYLETIDDSGVSDKK